MQAYRASATAGAVVATVLAALALGAPADSAPAAPFAPTLAAADTHPDPSGDANGTADITSVEVGNDYVTGSYVVWVDFANRMSLTTGDDVILLLDTDLNSGTGTNGFDYAIGVEPGNSCGLLQWQGSDFAQVASPTLECDFVDKSARIQVDPSDIGGSKAINFFVVTYNGDTRGDDAPDSGVYTYSAATGQVPLSLQRFGLVPSEPKAGKLLVAAAVVDRGDIDEQLDTGTVTCALRIGGKTVPAAAHGFLKGVATCAWRVPKKAKRKSLVGSISIAFGGSRLTKPFAARVH